MNVAEQLADGVTALHEGRAAEAATILDRVVNDQTFADQSDLRDLYARSCSLLAQALLQSGQASKARVPVRRALDLLTALGDHEGVAEVTVLQHSIGQAMQQQFEQMAKRRDLRTVAARPVEQMLQGVSDPEERSTLLVRRASAFLAAHRLQEVPALCKQAIDEARRAGSVRNEVLAAIAWSKAEPLRAPHVLEAARLAADTADEFNLVASVAKAASELGIRLDAPPTTP